MERKNAASEVSGRSRSQRSQRSTGNQQPRDASQDEFADALEGTARKEDGGSAEHKDPLWPNRGWPTTQQLIEGRGWLRHNLPRKLRCEALRLGIVAVVV